MSSVPDLSTCKKVGFIVPSSNTAVEPITAAIFRQLNKNVICLFTRIQVKTVGTDEDSQSQFTTEKLMEAARLLADAKPDAILWNGTSGMWLGGSVEDEKNLALEIEKAIGVPFSTTTLATIEALKHYDVDMISLATPYDEPLTAKITEFFSEAGYEVLKAERLKETPAGNLAIAKSRAEDIKDVIKRSRAGWTQATVIACTNWPASPLVEELETEMEVTIVDSIVATAWWGLRMAGIKGRSVGWGTLMDDL